MPKARQQMSPISAAEERPPGPRSRAGHLLPAEPSGPKHGALRNRPCSTGICLINASSQKEVVLLIGMHDTAQINGLELGNSLQSGPALLRPSSPCGASGHGSGVTSFWRQTVMLASPHRHSGGGGGSLSPIAAPPLCLTHLPLERATSRFWGPLSGTDLFKKVEKQRSEVPALKKLLSCFWCEQNDWLSKAVGLSLTCQELRVTFKNRELLHRNFRLLSQHCFVGQHGYLVLKPFCDSHLGAQTAFYPSSRARNTTCEGQCLTYSWGSGESAGDRRLNCFRASAAHFGTKS